MQIAGEQQRRIKKVKYILYIEKEIQKGKYWERSYEINRLYYAVKENDKAR